MLRKAFCAGALQTLGQVRRHDIGKEMGSAVDRIAVSPLDLFGGHRDRCDSVRLEILQKGALGDALGDRCLREARLRQQQ